MNKYVNDKLGLAHDIRAVSLVILKKIGIYKVPKDNLEHFTTFEEYPPCEMCASQVNKEILIATDGSKIVECQNCKLWFTSPRIEEEKWIKWLRSSDSQRNKELTENRIRYGVAMPRNIKMTRSGWYARYRKKYLKILNILMKHSKKPITKLHDVGCGVGFFLLVCREKGLDVSGNELNQYAVKIMRERFNLNIYSTILNQVPIEAESLDAITMNAYIEHTYHPLDDLRASYKFLKKGGTIYVSTFHVDSIKYDKLYNKWDMFEWNHVYHFSSNTLEKMIKKAGFQIAENNMKYESPISYIVGKKM